MILLVKKSPTNSKLTPEIILDIQFRYSQGEDLSEICKILNLKQNTLEKAVREARLILTPPSQNTLADTIETKSSRSVSDDQTAMGKACGNSCERVLASIGGASVAPEFKKQIDLSCAGVLLSLPALLGNGLLTHSQDFEQDSGYYSVESVFLSLAFLGLLRAKNIAQSEKIPCGELGRAIGLDRIPEVKTLRGRIDQFSKQINVQDWSIKLSKAWMTGHPDFVGVLYIDGHVNIYSGDQTKMPKRYASRLKLCMSGSTDYWVNDQIGQPFFVVNEAINSGMIDQIQTSILPRLNQEIPGQPSQEALDENPELHRYMIVCDRECFSADFFYDLWQQRIAICTYKKNVKDKWAESDFVEYDEIIDGEVIGKIKLAQKEITLKTENKNKIRCREVRKLTKSGHQTAIITTNWILSIVLIGIYMFARWCQENFFKYMGENFDIDGLVSYSKEEIADTKMLVNPEYKRLEYQYKSLAGKLSKQKITFANLSIKEGVEKGIKLEKLIAKKANALASIEGFQAEKTAIKEIMNTTDRKITFAALPKQEKFSNAINVQKQFMDQIKMICYRSETGMYNTIKNKLTRPDEGRKLLQELFLTDADIHPDYDLKTLTVKLHNLNHRNHDKIVQYLCNELNQTKTVFPGTDLTLIYKLVSS